MDTKTIKHVHKYINAVNDIKLLYSVMNDCICYHLSAGSDCNNIYSLAMIIQDKFKDLSAISEDILWEIYKK